MPVPRTVIEKAATIRLVNATPKHAPLLYAIFTGENTRKYSPVSGTSVGELARRLQSAGTDFSEKAAMYRFFGECDSVLFGSFVVKTIEWEKKEAEVGFSLLQEFQGKGLGTALIYRCVDKIFSEADIDRIWATASYTNTACLRLMRRVGFEECGEYKDAFRIQGRLVKQLLMHMDRRQWGVATRSIPTQGETHV